MKNKKGFIMAGVVMLLLLLIIIVPVMVRWIQDESRISVKDQKSSMAFSLAEAAVDRGFWEIKGSTATFAAASVGTVLAGYNFDATYTDMPGGTYRIKISSGPDTDQITIVGEGRDSMNRETRSITAVYLNRTVPGAILSGGTLKRSAGSVVHWGPVMSMGDMIVDAGAPHYPRKLSRQTVKPLDPTGDTNPPNTDSKEWWSNYNVPEMPVFDFATMKASAAANTALNCQDVSTITTVNIYSPCLGTACADTDGGGSGCTLTAAGVNTFVGTKCNDTDGGSSNCKCYTKSYGSACTSGGSCSCTGSGADQVCTGTGCTDTDGSGTYCVLYKYCTGTACVDSDASSGTFCVAGKITNGSACADSDGAASACVCNVTTTTVITYQGMKCCHSAVYGGDVTCDYGDGVTPCTNCRICDFPGNALQDLNYTWYWDHNLMITTDTVAGAGADAFNINPNCIASSSMPDISVKGTLVVRGDIFTSANSQDNYPSPQGMPVLRVPPEAWKEYQYLDTTASNQYPGDIKLSSSATTYKLGSCGTGGTSCPASMGCTNEGSAYGAYTGCDLGISGFLYVGGAGNMNGACDIYGAAWVVGDFSGADNTTIFYDSSLKVPTLNVVLQKESWKESKPNTTTAWP